jgi:hypothetical protein
MNRFAITTVALAIGLAAAPQVWAQSPTSVQVCRDGTVMRSANSAACILHGGLDQQATSQAGRGIYTPNGTAGTRGVYDGGSANGANRQIYGGGNNSGVWNRSQSNNGNGRWKRERDRDKDHDKWKRENRHDNRRDQKLRDRDRDHDRDHDHDRYRSSNDRR